MFWLDVFGYTPTGNHTGQPPANFAQAPSGAGCARLAALGSLRSPSLRRPRKGRSDREELNYRTNFTPAAKKSLAKPLERIRRHLLKSLKGLILPAELSNHFWCLLVFFCFGGLLSRISIFLLNSASNVLWCNLLGCESSIG